MKRRRRRQAPAPAQILTHRDDNDSASCPPGASPKPLTQSPWEQQREPLTRGPLSRIVGTAPATPPVNTGKSIPGLFEGIENIVDQKLKPPDTRKPRLEEREQRIWAVIRKGARGLQYCRELDNAGIGPPRKGRIWRDGPRKYEGAYKSSDSLRHWIQDEKTKIRRKAELANRRTR